LFAHPQLSQAVLQVPAVAAQPVQHTVLCCGRQVSAAAMVDRWCVRRFCPPPYLCLWPCLFISFHRVCLPVSVVALFLISSASVSPFFLCHFQCVVVALFFLLASLFMRRPWRLTDSVPGAVLFLRYLNPAICSPEKFGLVRGRADIPAVQVISIVISISLSLSCLVSLSLKSRLSLSLSVCRSGLVCLSSLLTEPNTAESFGDSQQSSAMPYKRVSFFVELR
jgi:hypothetical protein